jgi:hypothetical protein
LQSNHLFFNAIACGGVLNIPTDNQQVLYKKQAENRQKDKQTNH